MKIRLLTGFVFVSLVTPLSATAGFQLSGQLQQEFVNWMSGPSRLEGKAIDDGGQYQGASNTGSASASYIAINAQENLKNHKRGIAHVSFWISPDDHAASGVTGMDAYLGFENEYSTWTFGTQSTAYMLSTAGWDPFWATFMQARGNGGASLLLNSRSVGNSVNYRSNWWGADVAYSWGVDDSDTTPADGKSDRNDLNSVSFTFPQNDWTYVIAYEDDGRFAGGHATKLGVRVELDKKWKMSLQMEGLGGGVGDGETGFLSFEYQSDPDLQYGMNFGRFSSNNNSASPSLNYVAMGMKYAFTKKAVTHLGVRHTQADTVSNENEFAWGIGLRYRF